MNIYSRLHIFCALSFIFSVLLLSTNAHADEGMWMLSTMGKKDAKLLQQLGLHMPIDKIYSVQHPALSNAVVSFGGFCSGVIISPEGLLLTNHHCGFGAIQQQSTVENDYLEDGYVAKTKADEIPCPGLYARFMLVQKDVTKRMLSSVTPTMFEERRIALLDSTKQAIEHEVALFDSTLVAVVDGYYAGNEYFLSVYRDYPDVRLVFTPPSSIGKFGWDKDNWMWPRHTGDFSVFRVYADAHNNPNSYDEKNVPFRPNSIAPISLKGYKKGDFTMTIGYPGATGRYVSAAAIKERMYAVNAPTIDIRRIKQKIWKQAMANSDSIRIKYASKYDASSNYYKNAIGMNLSVSKRGVLTKRQAQERVLQEWIKRNPNEPDSLLKVLPRLQRLYDKRREVKTALTYFSEAFANGPELIDLAISILNFDMKAPADMVVANIGKLVQKYSNMDANVDKKVCKAMFKTFKERVDRRYWPETYARIDTVYGGSIDKYIDDVYARTWLSTPRGMMAVFSNDSTYNLIKDPATDLSIDMIVAFIGLNNILISSDQQVQRDERVLNAALRRLYNDRQLYPDANSTMRLSYGHVAPYSPRDGVDYEYYTTTDGIFEKINQYHNDPDFYVQSYILDLLKKKEWGVYAAQDSTMHTCFITNNDITGGNSGSALFNAQGEVIGLAFDGNWEAMDSDVQYEPAYQRCINVDIRYVLYLIEKLSGDTHLIDEMIIRTPNTSQ